MIRALALLLMLGMLLGATEPPPAAKSFTILGASLHLNVVRNGVTLPATMVPFLKPGDTIAISFPKGVQFSRSPRWHLVVANMYENYLAHAPAFPIPDANLNAAKPGHVWTVRYDGTATPMIFLVPENGGRHGHGIPEARAAIGELANRSLLAKTALFAASAAAKKSTLSMFLTSMSSLQPGQLSDGRARVSAATQSLFGYDLGDATCFSAGVPQSTQDACAAQALAADYQTPSTVAVATSIGDQLSINAATYGMLIGALYALLAKRRVQADYAFVPGTLRPGSSSTDIYVGEQPQYDASAAKPSTIVYFQIGSEGTKPSEPAYGAVPALPVCVAGPALEVPVPFSGLPVYFREHAFAFSVSGKSFTVPATYDAILGYRATLSPAQTAMLRDDATMTLSTLWGFDRFTSAPMRAIVPKATAWASTGDTTLTQGTQTATLSFTDGAAGMGSCVKSIAVDDGLGHALPITALKRTLDGVTATVDARDAGGAAGTAVITEYGGIAAKPIAFTLVAAMPSIASAIAYLPRGVLVLRGSRLKYIRTLALENTGITFGDGTPQQDGSWIFTAQTPTAYQNAWEHETMTLRFTLQPPDARTDAIEADVEYAAPNAAPSPAATPTPR